MAITVVTSLNTLENNITFQKTPVSNKFYSSKLLNYIESVEIKGKKKTVFYSELNTNFNVGDRIHIVNGNYDSNLFISNNKYTKYTDGYRVLGCDGCRIILDIEFTGELPFIDNQIDKLVKIHTIKNQREFDYVNSIMVEHDAITFSDLSNTYTIFPSQGRTSKFGGKKFNLGTGPTSTAVLFCDSLIYCTANFAGSTDSLIRNSGVLSGGFYVRDDTSANRQWISVTNEVLSGNIKIVNPLYNDVNKNLYINGEDFTIGSTTFKQRNVYTFTNNSWDIDIKYKKPFISRLNFRYGTFKGKHNDGIFGTNLKRNNWDNATWNSGVILNSVWNEGVMSTKSQLGERLFFSTFESGQNSPVQTIDFSNNKGFGYNLIEDSDIFKGDVVNGNFENCNIGLSSTFSAVNIYFGQTHSFDMKISGFFKNCDINSVITDSAKVNNSKVINSLINKTDLINSQIYYSTANSSKFTDEESITVIDSRISAYVINNSSSSTANIRGILKLYISDVDATKISSGDVFYLSRINKNLFLNSLDDDLKIKLPVETKYLFDYYNDFELSRTGKIIVSLKSKNDNKITTFVQRVGTTYVTNFFQSNLNYASIDIDTRAFSFWNQLTTISQNQPIGLGLEYCLGNILPEQASTFFSNSIVRKADFINGYFDKSEWVSGANLNYRHHIIPSDINSQLQINSFTTDTITINLSLNQLNFAYNLFGEDLVENDIVWLNSIEEIDGSISKKIGGRYKVVSATITGGVKEVTLQNLEGITFSSNPTAYFQVTDAATNNYVSIHKFRINDSKITSGLFIRTSLTNNVINNSQFDNNDRGLNISNIERLRLINILFKNSSNQVNSGYIFKSHFINDVWNNGIIFNSIWNGGIFKSGTFNSGYWQKGRFLNGSFINSKNTSSTRVNYDTNSGLYKTWLDGTFEGGEFFNSTWMKGNFLNGRFYNSDWFSGTWSNGILGSTNLRFTDTRMAFREALPISGTYTNWLSGTVENAIVGGSSSIYWYSGKFNNGEFTSFGQSSTSESIWYDGDFNNGRFSGLSRWKNGRFFKGKFTSYYGMNSVSPVNPSTFSTDYSWENGKFIDGEFGNASTGTNSVWFNGEFTGGIFQGRFWYNGIFTNGDFLGSGTSSIYNSYISNVDEAYFANSFRSNYYGLWFGGNVSDNVKGIKENQRVFTELVRKVDEKSVAPVANFKNVLWINGTFSHKGGTFENSLWLNGVFVDGFFNSSIFNAYVDRTFSGLATYSFASTQSCIWQNGYFDSTLGTGSFYISNWNRGVFNNGYMSGATWKQGIWNYGFADNLLWLDGIWRNGNWNGAPFGYSSLSPTASYKFLDGRSKDIVLNVASNLGSELIYINNGFSASTGTSIIEDPTIRSLDLSTSSVTQDTIDTQYIFEAFNTNSFAIPSGLNSPVSVNVQVLNRSEWRYGTTFSISDTAFVTNTNVYTTGGDPVPSSIIGADIIPESRKLFACKPNINNLVFSVPDKTYVIFLQITVEETESVEVLIKVGDKDLVRLNLPSNPIRVGNRIIYYPRQHTMNLIYTTPDTAPLTSEQQQFYIAKGRGGILRVLTLSIVERVFEYHPVYNNTIYEAIDLTTKQITLPSDPRFEVFGISTDANLVSVNLGNGLFKSGTWENGIWNNGFRSNTFVNEKDYYLFSNVVGLNGITPYQGKGTYQTGTNNWLVTLQSIDTLDGLNVGDRVSIGNLIAIDINESRKLIKDFFIIQQIDLDNRTIVVELVLNFPILRVERDSNNHLMYLTKNIWLTGAFLNGVFRGVWNQGLFKSFPKIGLISNSQWIDGEFDGGRFYATKVIDNSGLSYSTGLIQNFVFYDNNSVTNRIFNSGVGTVEYPKYESWIDVNYSNVSKTTINQNSISFKLDNYPKLPLQIPNPPRFLTYSIINNNIQKSFDNALAPNLTNVFLQGDITYDVLESTSSLKNYQNIESLYRLGTKYKVFNNFIPNNGNFLTPFSNNIGFGLTMTPFTEDGWRYSDYANLFTPINLTTTASIRIVNPNNQLLLDSNVPDLDILSSLENKFRIQTTDNSESVVIQVWTFTYRLECRFARIVIGNDNVDTLPDRYYITQVELERLLISPADYTSISAANSYTYSTVNFNLTPGVNDYEAFQSNQNKTSLTKSQFSFNKQSLGLNIEVVSTHLQIASLPPSFPTGPIKNTISIIFNNISFLEVDMIPFFNYFGSQNSIDMQIKTPWFGVAPTIDYTNADFDFLGNINLTIDSRTIRDQVNYSVISGNVSGSITSTIPGSGPTIFTIESLSALRPDLAQ